MSSKCVCKAGAPAYMLTFGDLMSLLLTFFVLLISMASFEPAKFAMTSSSLQGAFGVLETFPTVVISPIVNIPKYDDANKRKESKADVEELKKKMESENLESSVKVKVTETGIAVLLSDPQNFASGSNELSPRVKVALKEIAKIMNKDVNAVIRVEGHTDDVPIRSAKFPSNWELSAARALSVVKFLALNSKMDPGRMSAVGYGEFRPIVPNTSAENREKNRRIEIYIDYTKKE